MPSNPNNCNNCGCTPNPLDSGNWESESTVGRKTTTSQGDPDPEPNFSVSPECSPGALCSIELSVSPEAVCCMCADCSEQFLVTASASSSDCKITVSKPDGTSETGTGTVSFTYFVRDTDCGKKLTFKASGEGTCIGDEKDAYVIGVKFKVIKWTPVVLNAASMGVFFYTVENFNRAGGAGEGDFSLFPLGGWAGLQIPTTPKDENGDEKKIFSVTGTVQIDSVPAYNTLPRSVKPVADGCCARWKLVVQQAITGNALIYEHTAQGEAINLKDVPCLDQREGRPTTAKQTKQFSKSGDVVTVKIGDLPNMDARFDKLWKFPGSPQFEMDLGKSVHRKNSFHDWLYVKNDTCKLRLPLKWAAWKIDWHLTYGVAIGGLPKPIVKWVTKINKLTGQGDGEGPLAIMEVPFLSQEYVVFPMNNIPGNLEQP